MGCHSSGPRAHQGLTPGPRHRPVANPTHNLALVTLPQVPVSMGASSGAPAGLAQSPDWTIFIKPLEHSWLEGSRAMAWTGVLPTAHLPVPGGPSHF